MSESTAKQRKREIASQGARENRGSAPHRAAFAALSATLAAAVLVIAPGLQFFDITPRIFLVLAGACITWLLIAWEGSRIRFARPARFFLAALGGLALIAAASTLASQDRVLSLAGSEWRRMGLPVWLSLLALAGAVPVAVGGSVARRRALSAVLAGSTAVAAAYAIAQYAGYDPWINAALYHIGEGEWQIVRPPATLGYVNYFGLVAVAGLFLAAGLALSSARARARWAWAAAAMVLGMGIIVSGSRGAWLGAGAGVVVLVARAAPVARRALLAGLLMATFGLALLVASPLGLPVRSRLRWFVEDPAGGARLLLWRDSLRMAAARPLLGHGPDTFGAVFPRHQSLELAERFPDNYVESAHNVVLDYATAAGVPAALLFLALLGAAAWPLVTRRNEWAEEQFEGGLLAALAGGFVCAQFLAETVPTRLVLLVLAALAVSGARSGNAGPEGAPPNPAEPTILAAPRKWRLAAGGFSLVCLAGSLYFGGRLLAADRHAFLATEAATAFDIERLTAEGRAAAGAFPWAGTYAHHHSRLLGRIAGNPQVPAPARALVLALAESAARSAVSDSDRPQLVWVHLASIHALQDRRPEAISDLEAAILAAPAWYRPRWLLAVLLFEQGRRAEAAEQARAALERGARRHPEISRSCLEIQRLSGN